MLWLFQCKQKTHRFAKYPDNSPKYSKRLPPLVTLLQMQRGFNLGEQTYINHSRIAAEWLHKNPSLSYLSRSLLSFVISHVLPYSPYHSLLFVVSDFATVVLFFLTSKAPSEVQGMHPTSRCRSESPPGQGLTCRHLVSYKGQSHLLEYWISSQFKQHTRKW